MAQLESGVNEHHHGAADMTPQQILDTYGPRESMEYDVVRVGVG